jgi:hypothetical protein
VGPQWHIELELELNVDCWQFKVVLQEDVLGWTPIA